MHKIILFTTFFLLSLPSFTQEVKPSPALSREDYLKKSKNQKKVGWILLGGGVTLITVGLLVTDKQIDDDPWGYITGEYAGGSMVLALAGVGSTLASIPFFIASGKNKRRGAAVSFKMEKANIINQWALSNNPYPAISIRFCL
jgi:hypothetical protein